MMLIFIFQSIWLFIDDLAGRGLDMMIIGKFFFYKMPELTEKVLPLTVLLSSILTFGTFAENYEFAAMKASGISLQRSMLPIIIFIFFLGMGTFWFANSVIPASEQKIFNLRRNIAKLKPAVAIAEGVFSDFETADMNIKVDNKYGENDRFLENVIIHQKTPTNINYRVVKSEKGELISAKKSDLIQLVLNDGHFYQDIQSKGQSKLKHPFAKGTFETYTMNIDLSEFNNVDLEEERDTRTEKMKNVSRLRKDIDSLKKDNLRIVRAFSKNVLSTKMGAFAELPFKDSSQVKMALSKKDSLYALENPIKKMIGTDGTEIVENLVGIFPEWQQVQLMNSAKNNATNILTSIQGKKNELDKRYEIHRRHVYATHEKFALAFSCIILFFVGAPLGAIIRKGGLGLPMVVAIVLFLVYYFLGVFAENYAYKGNMHPILGAWTPTLIMLPLGISLTKRATADKGLMAFGRIFDFISALFKKLKKKPTV
jgi:lipopolysaccharide export system permease protein